MNNLAGLKIGFFGTPDFSLQFLRKLYSEKATISFVVSQPPSRSGRGKLKKQSPVILWAQEKKIEYFTPENLSNEEFKQTIKKKRN